jgi:hypothetical protein
LKALVIRYCPALFGSSRAVSEEDRTGQSSLVELGKSRRSELIKVSGRVSVEAPSMRC